MNINTTIVENTVPKLNAMAKGTKNRACGEVSNNIGSKPAVVVNDVSTIGLKRLMVACFTASE